MQKNHVLSKIVFTSLLITIFCVSAEANSDSVLDLKIATADDGVLVYIQSGMLRRIVNRRFALARISKSLSKPLSTGELGLEIVDDNGMKYPLKTLYNRDLVPSKSHFTAVNRGQIVGVSLKYCKLVVHYALQWGKKYRVRAVYSNTQKVNGAFKGTLWTDWIEITLPESQNCGKVDTTM